MNNLLKLFLLFLAAIAIVSFLLTPALLFAFDADADNIRALQEESQKIAATEDISPGMLQQTVTESAKRIKAQITQGDYLFIYSSQIGYNLLCFLICGLIFRKIGHSKLSNKVDWNKTPGMLYVLAPILLITALPIIGQSLQLNEWLGINKLMEHLDYDVNVKSVGNMIFSYAVFVPESIPQLITSLIFVAIVPAFGEEIFFRGSLQKTLQGQIGNIHNTIFITALIFSAFHWEITAFFYRFFLGVLLGYTFYWTKNLFIPILIHALNNGISVAMMYYTNEVSEITETPNQSGPEAFALIISTVSAAGILWIYHLYHKKPQFKLM